MVDFRLLRRLVLPPVTSIAGVGICLVPLFLSAQESPDGAGRRLVQVGDRDGPGLEGLGGTTWRERLGDADLERRGRSYEILLAEARKAAALRTEIQSWTRTDGASSVVERELAWTGRLLLGDLERVCQSCGASRQGRPPGLPRWFDAFGGGADPFQQLREQMERLQQGWPGVPRTSARESEGLRVEMGPNGVRVEIGEGRDGESETRVYEAKTIEDLLQAHPELRGRMGSRFPLWRAGPGEGGETAELFPFERLFTGAPLRTDVLGVVLRQPSGDGDEGGAERPGLLVDRTLGGTIASVLGLRRGDRLLSLNGLPLEKAADVTRILEARSTGGEVRLVWEDVHGRRRERVWREPPGAEEPGEDATGDL
jgi:hypothetical protein